MSSLMVIKLADSFPRYQIELLSFSYKELSGKCVAMSEPTAMNDLPQLYKAKPDDVKTEQFARSIISILCKPVSRPSENALYLVKVTSTSVALMPLLNKLYPDAKFLFMYRNVVNVSTSVYRSMQFNAIQYDEYVSYLIVCRQRVQLHSSMGHIIYLSDIQKFYTSFR